MPTLRFVAFGVAAALSAAIWTAVFSFLPG